MSTIQQPEARGDGSRGFTSGSDAHADLADIVLLLATILILMGVAAGIAIGFPLALEVAATHANAAAIASLAPEPRPLEDAPIIVDDIRPEELMHAAAPITAPFDRSTPQQSTHR